MNTSVADSPLIYKVPVSSMVTTCPFSELSEVLIEMEMTPSEFEVKEKID